METTTSNCFDVASYILEKKNTMPVMKLQKLVYYCQAWSLVWDDAPLFDNRIEAWINGPVVVDLYNYHKGHYRVGASFFKDGNSSRLNSIQKETIDRVLDFYGDKDSQWLSNLTHLEEPWKNARKGLDAKERGNREITWESMAEYYSSIPPEED